MVKKWTLQSSLPPTPNEEKLSATFRAKRDIFDKLQSIAFQNESIAFRIGKTDADSSGLSANQLRETRYLLSTIDPDAILIMNREEQILSFIFQGGGSQLPTGPQWSIGIEYIPKDVEKHGRIVNTFKDIDLNAEGFIYLLPLDTHWYCYYQNY